MRMIPRRRYLQRRLRSAPTISLACVSGSSPQQARAFLLAWRPLVDEVVLAVEQDNDAAILAACDDLADRTYVLPSGKERLWMERYLAWLHEQCRGQWVLRADDDELPSEALRRALPGMLGERELTHLWLPRRWVFPNSGHFIAQGLWLRDIQVRLVRNLPGLWRLSGQRHSNLVVEGASRISDAPLLHLDSLIKLPAARREKIEQYRSLLGEIISDGYPIYGVYEPEAVPELRLGELPDADQRTIERFTNLLHGQVPARRRNRSPELVSPDRIYRWVGVRELSEGAYAASIRLVHPLEPMPAGSIRHIQVEVTNGGTEWWPRGPGPQPQIYIGHRWRRADRSELAVQTPRTAFTELVAPGAVTRLVVAIQAPSKPGAAELELDLVHEFVRWFECPTHVEVDILAAAEGTDTTRRTSSQSVPVITGDT
jgi:hypothetical protein